MKISKLTQLISLTAVLLLLTFTLAACQKNNPNESTGKSTSDSTTALIPVEEEEHDDIDYLFNNGLLSVQINGKHGYIDEQGNVVIQPQFDYASDFNSDGIAYVLTRTADTEKWFLIDKQGNQVGPHTFNYIEGPYNGYFLTHSDSVKQGIVDKTGNYIMERNNWKYEIECDGGWLPDMVVIERNMKYGLMDLNGNVVVEPQYDELEWMTEEGLAVASIDYEKYGFIDKTGKVVIDLQYDYAGSFSEDLKGLAYVSKGKKAGYINTAGEMVHKIPRKKDYTTWYPDVEGTYDEHGLAIVCLKRKKGEKRKAGIIDRDGNFVVPAKFRDIEPFSENGLAPACIDKKYGYIDKTGNFVIEPKYNYSYSFDENGLAMVEINKKCGFINANGDFVIQPKYEYFSSWIKGRIWATIGKKLILLNGNGDTLKEFDIKLLDSIGGDSLDEPNGYVVFINAEKKYVIVNIDGQIIGEYAGFKYKKAKDVLCKKPNCYNLTWDDWTSHCKKHS